MQIIVLSQTGRCDLRKKHIISLLFDYAIKFYIFEFERQVTIVLTPQIITISLTLRLICLHYLMEYLLIYTYIKH